MYRPIHSSGRSYYGYSEGNFYCNNNGDDDEEDDDDLVIYKERNNSQSDGLLSRTQSQSRSPLKSPTPQRSVIPKVTHMMSRQERRRRRQEWKERTMMENAGYGYGDDESESEEDGLGSEEDPFASLRSMLESQQEVEDEQNESDSSSENSEEDIKQRADTHRDGTGNREVEGNGQGGDKLQFGEIRDMDNVHSEPDNIDKRQMIPPNPSNTGNCQNHQADLKVQAPHRGTLAEEPIQPSPPDFLFFDDGQDDRDMEDEQSNDTRARHKIPATISVFESPTYEGRKRSRSSSSRKKQKRRELDTKHGTIGREKRSKHRRHTMDESELLRHRWSHGRRSSTTGRSESRVRSKKREGRIDKSRSSSSSKLRRNSGRVSLPPNSKSVVGTR